MLVNWTWKDLSYEDFFLLAISKKHLILKEYIINNVPWLNSIHHDNNHSLMTFLISIWFNKRDACYYSCWESKDKSVYYNNEKVYIEYDEWIIISFIKDLTWEWILEGNDLTTESVIIATVKKYVCLDVDKLLKAVEWL